MTSATNLLNLNVDALFEQHSVPEIDIVHKKIQKVVENKREELRQMVGERYRDLLKAADTIADMQKSSADLVTQVEAITSECRKLNAQQLPGSEATAPEDTVLNRNANKRLTNYFSTMIQIKLLTELPQLIWSHIDNEQFCAASELFIFSRHISTGLQLDVNNSLMQHLPIAKKQWEILKPFHATIYQNLLRVLEREELNAETAVDCLLALLLLEKITLNGVFKTFLQLRCTAFLNCLSEENKQADGHLRRIKQRILASLKILNNTMDLMAKCFMENGLLFQKLSEHSDPNTPPTIMLIDANDAPRFSCILPEIISNFKPKLETLSLSEVEVRAFLEKWLSDTRSIANIHLRNLFNFVTSMSTIQEIKSEANAHKRHLNFEPIIKKFQLAHSLDFYKTNYVPLINQRVHDIIYNSWAKAMQTTFKSLESALSEVGSSTADIWVENNNDLPPSLEIALSDDLKRKRLLMKSKGYDTKILNLCKEFDLELAGIISEMNVVLEEQGTKTEDKVALVVFLRETAEEQLKNFLSKVKGLNLTACQYGKLLFVVRTCVALVEICPNLKICLYQRGNWHQWVGSIPATNSLEHWNIFCQMLEEETLHFWRLIIDGILEKNEFLKYFPLDNSYNNMLEDFSNWETVTLEQRDDQETAIQSSFRIPNQPRISLQTYLFTLIRTLTSIIPQTLPTQVLHYHNTSMLAQLLVHYKTLATDNLTSSSQYIALQLYFDLKFLQNVFAISRDDHIRDQFIALQNTLKELIDPFDFELLVEHILTNVKRSAARFNCEFGVLASPLQVGAVVPAALVHEKDPNVLSLCASGSTSIWFPLLPIVMPANMNESIVGSTKKSDLLETEKATYTSKPAAAMRKGDLGSSSKTKSSAASFFGAMSQDWFR